MSNCELRETSLEGWRDNLGRLHNAAISDVQAHLFPKASFANKSKEMLIGHTVGNMALTLSEDLRIVELAGQDFQRLVGSGSPSFYHTEYGKILLRRERWCLKNLYHEVLHSLSIFSCLLDLRPRTDSLAESLTEFLTGALLWKTHRECYEKCWRTLSGRECQYTYAPNTNYWCAFFQGIKVCHALPIYFWNGNSDWRSLFLDFTLQIRNSGYPNFTNVLMVSSTLPLAMLFHDECVYRFGETYEDACEWDPDFDKVIW